MKTNLPNLPDNYRVEFEGTTIRCTYSLAFPKNLVQDVPNDVLRALGITRTRRGFRCINSTIANNTDEILTKYLKLKNLTMVQCREAKIKLLKAEVAQLELF